MTTSSALPVPPTFSIFAFIGFACAISVTAWNRPSSVPAFSLSGTPGGTRTPNLRFWRPLLCQLSYWRVVSSVPRGNSGGLLARRHFCLLLDDLGNDARTDRAAAFADREAKAFFHRDRRDQAHHHFDVVARHHHLDAFRQLHRTRDVGRAEVELRTVALEERRMTAAFFLREHVHLRLELRVRVDRAGLAQHLAALDLVALRAAEQDAGVVACLALVQQL